jgi:hypothetical protein
MSIWLLCLALVSGFLFGIVPVRQVLRTNPYQMVKSGDRRPNTGRRITVRDVLLVVQIADLRRAGHFFDGCRARTHALSAQQFRFRSAERDAGGYRLSAWPVTAATSAGHATAHDRSAGRQFPAFRWDFIKCRHWGGGERLDSDVFTDETTDLRPSNAVAYRPGVYGISPDYFHAAGTSVLFRAGHSPGTTTNAPRVAVVNKEFARKIFGSVTGAIGRYSRCRMGRAYRWWALWKTENTGSSPKIHRRRCSCPSCNRLRA